MNAVTRLTVRLGDVTKTVTGRDAWALNELLASPLLGVTPLHNPAPRWSHYIFKLRRAGFDIETIDEAHAGPYAGHHARYVLRSAVTVLDTVRGEHRKAA